MLEFPVAAGYFEAFIMLAFAADGPRFDATGTIWYDGSGDGVKQFVVEETQAAQRGQAHARNWGREIAKLGTEHFIRSVL